MFQKQRRGGSISRWPWAGGMLNRRTSVVLLWNSSSDGLVAPVPALSVSPILSLLSRSARSMALVSWPPG